MFRLNTKGPPERSSKRNGLAPLRLRNDDAKPQWVFAIRAGVPFRIATPGPARIALALAVHAAPAVVALDLLTESSEVLPYIGLAFWLKCLGEIRDLPAYVIDVKLCHPLLRSDSRSRIDLPSRMHFADPGERLPKGLE